MTALPALRAVDAYPLEHEGKQLYCLYDPTLMVEERVLMTPPGIFVASHLDGFNTLVDVRQAFQQQFDGAALGELEEGRSGQD